MPGYHRSRLHPQGSPQWRSPHMISMVQQPHDTGNNNRNALVRDPDGNLVEIVAKRS
jgi:hypothetical protein